MGHFASDIFNLGVFSRFIHAVARINTSFLFMPEYISVQMCCGHTIYGYCMVRACWWTFESIPSFGYYEQHCYEHFCTSFCVEMFSFLLSIQTAMGLLGYTVPLYITVFILFFLLLFICAYKAWVISPPCPHPLPYHPLRPLPLPPHPLNTQQKLFCPYF
jgi:hypothetical protein